MMRELILYYDLYGLSIQLNVHTLVTFVSIKFLNRVDVLNFITLYFIFIFACARLQITKFESTG